MCFHSNQHPSSIKHPFTSLYSKYQSFIFTCFPDMNSSIFPSLDDIYCMNLYSKILLKRAFCPFLYETATKIAKVSSNWTQISQEWMSISELCLRIFLIMLSMNLYREILFKRGLLPVFVWNYYINGKSVFKIDVD